MASLQDLRDEIEAFCRARALALAEEATGRSRLADLGAVERAHPSVVAPDTVPALQAALASPRTPDAQRPRLAALVAFLARAAIDARVRSSDDALRVARQATRISAAGVTRPLAGAWSAVADEPDRLRRAALAEAAAEAELRLLGHVQRRWEEARNAAQALAGPAQDASGSPAAAAALEVEAAEFLRSTEEPWREVLAYACRRLEPELRPLPRGDAALHDLLRLADAPLPGAFPPAERLPAVRRWLDGSSLSLEAGGRVRLDAPATGTVPHALAFEVDVPDRILLVTPSPASGHGSFPALLDAVGHARAAAAVSATAPLEARRLGDRAVPAATGWLLRGVLRSDAWLRHFLGHGRAMAREVARLSALAQLGELRMLAARLPLLRALSLAGPSLSGVEAVAGAVSEAVFLRIQPGAVLSALVGWPAEPDALRAAALAERMQQQADERFDADDFRNPAAARWLAGLWARGTDSDADALAMELSGAPLSLADLSQRLVAVLGA
jgi:hypothetical protein